MSDNDTGETSRFKIKPIEPVTNVEGTTNTGDNSQNDESQTLFTAAAQKADKHKKKKKKRKIETSPASSPSDLGNSSSSKESVEEGNSTKTTDFKSYLNLRVTNGSFLVKWQIMSITSLSALSQKRIFKKIFRYYSSSLRMSGASKSWTIL